MTLDLNAKRIYVMLKHSTAIFAFFCIFWASEKSFWKILQKALDMGVHPVVSYTRRQGQEVQAERKAQ